MSDGILVVGGAGYVGSVLVPALADRGHQVTVVDKLWFGNHLPDYIPVIEKDFFDLTGDDIERYNTVVFLGGLSNDPMADYSPSQNFISNAAGPAFLAYLARKAGVRKFIHGGSCSVYGNSPNIVVRENSPAASDFPYGISKVIGEDACLQMADEDFNVISLRKGTVSGHSPRMRFDLIVNRMMRDAFIFKKITVNNPDIWRPILAMKDAVEAYIMAIECGWVMNDTFNIATCNAKVIEVAQAVHKFLTQETGFDIEIKVNAVEENRNYSASISRADHILGFVPHESLETIVEDVWRHWKSYGDLFNPRYYNIDTFRTMSKTA